MACCVIVNDHSLARDGTGVALCKAFNDFDVFIAASLGEAVESLCVGSAIDLALPDPCLTDIRGTGAQRRRASWCAVASAADICALVMSVHVNPGRGGVHA